VDPITWLSEYVPLHKPKSKFPKDIHENKTPLQTPLLSDEISFDGLRLAWVLILKLGDWDLAHHEKFPHLETEQLMHHIIETNMGMTTLEPQSGSRGYRR